MTLSDRVRMLSLHAPWMLAEISDLAAEVQRVERALDEIVANAAEDEALRAIGEAVGNVIPFRWCGKRRG